MEYTEIESILSTILEEKQKHWISQPIKNGKN